MSTNSSDLDSDPTITLLDEPEHPGALKLWNYWLEKRGDKRVPDRSDIGLTDLSDIAPNLLITEVVEGTTDFRIRLYGSAVAEITGQDRTGKMVSEVGEELGGDTQNRWRAVTARAAENMAPVILKARGSRPETEHLMFHSVTLPLTNGSEEITQYLGGMFTSYLSEEA
ncbi:MAG: PAS domain-containing protein [Candidatus Phaeomarinobacter sp.]